MIRICHLVRQFHPSVGGLESFVDDLTRHLALAGCANEIVTLDRLFTDPERRLPRMEKFGGAVVRRVPMVGGRRMFAPIIPERLLRDCDVLHVHGIDGMFERVARRRRRPGQAHVATSHGGFFHTRWMAPVKTAYFNTITRMAARNYDCLIANSDSDASFLRRISRDVVSIPNGVRPLGDTRAHGRDLLFVGRLSINKRVDRLVHALAQPALSDAVLHVVGPDWEVRRHDLQQLASALGVGGRVRLHGRLSAERLREVAADCGVFVSASTYEGFGMSMIEAMGVGLVPVVHPNASFTELVTAAKLGALVDFADPAHSAAAIRAARAGLETAARDAAIAFAKRYAWPAHAARTLAVYERLLAGAPADQFV